MLSQAGRQHLHPRQAFIHDLEKYIAQLQAQGNEIILGGDFNESLDDRNSGIHRLVTSQNLVDPFLTKFPHAPEFGTHCQGKRRIDPIFVSPNILTTITKIGYTPYEFSTPSDHRACMIEFNTNQLFGRGYKGANTPTITQVLRTKDKPSVEKFIRTWFRLLSDQGIFSTLSKIDDDSVDPTEVERIDTLIGSCGKEAKKECRRPRPEFYCRALVQQRVIVSVLRSHLRSLRKGTERQRQLLEKLNRCGASLTLSPSIQAIQKLREICKDHAEKRQQELAKKITEVSGHGHKTKAQILKAIKKAEMHQSTYRILRNMRNRSTRTGGIDRVDIPLSWPALGTPLDQILDLEEPKQCNHWRTVTDPSAVEYYLMLRNRLHFGQAEGTPFTQPPLVEDLTWDATSNAAEAILQGTYTASPSTPNCDNLLHACRQIDEADETSGQLTLRIPPKNHYLARNDDNFLVRKAFGLV